MYLGDGVYVQEIFGMVALSTENGLEVTNQIFLEPQVLIAFEEWLKTLRSNSTTARQSD